MRRTLAILAALTAAPAIAGCGNERTQPPDVVSPAPARGDRQVRLPEAGIRFTAPFNWSNLGSQGAWEGGIQSNTATVAIWRYRRTEPLPATDDALREARDLLVERIKVRDPSFSLRSTRLGRVGGARAVQVVGRQMIAGLPFDVRSTHVFDRGAEVVIDAYARPQDFARVDQTVFRPLLRSVRLSAPRAAEAEADGADAPAPSQPTASSTPEPTASGAPSREPPATPAATPAAQPATPPGTIPAPRPAATPPAESGP